MLIHQALLKYGYSGFKLEILEYCDKEKVIQREQYYLDLLQPEYNILKFARSNFNFRHSEETKAKMKELAKNRIYSEEFRARSKKLNLYRSEELKEQDKKRLLELNKSKGHPIEVLNILTNQKVIYSSIRQTANNLGVTHVTILRVIKSQRLLKGIYKINRVLDNNLII